MPGRKQDGSLIPSEIVILRHLEDAPLHPYALAEQLLMGTSGIRKTLSRLERSGHVASKWDMSAPGPGPPRRVYRLTRKGRSALKKVPT